MPIERLGFSVAAARATPDGWHLTGEPEYHPRHRPRPGERFDRVRNDGDRELREVDLVVTECSAGHVLVTGAGGDFLVRHQDRYLVVTGERTVPSVPLPQPGAAGLAAILGAEPEPVEVDWPSLEQALRAELPADYKEFVGTFGAASIDDHVSVCEPGRLLEHHAWVRECLAIDEDDRPDWFAPGDRVISWGSTENGDILGWLVSPGAAPPAWPVVFKEEGPLWQRFPAGFTTTMAGLLTGDLQSWYLSSRLGGDHSYR
ncbi:hypothetical protein [Actinoplanes sp. NPDC020271]|uniref:hypothetical protein n=1 Tax=Actinoplanes sp. NPDC020271 TaxID=3363896 RepID=UPI0037B74335